MIKRLRCAHCGHILSKQADKSNEAAIIFYYRSRGPGGQRTTLRDVAERFELSYEALRKYKQRYDAAGKWGAKNKATP